MRPVLRTIAVALLASFAAAIGTTLVELAREAIENRLDPLPERRRRRRSRSRRRR